MSISNFGASESESSSEKWVKGCLTCDQLVDYGFDDYDHEYHTWVRHQPMTELQSLLGSSFLPNGKPIELFQQYYLRGSQVYGAAIVPETKKRKRRILYDELVNLDELSTMTRPAFRESKGFFTLGPTVKFNGEHFYKKHFDYSTGKEKDPVIVAFTLRAPESQSLYSVKDWMKFCNLVKGRIMECRSNCEER